MRQSGSTLQQIADWANKEGILNNHGKPFSYVAFSFISSSLRARRTTLLPGTSFSLFIVTPSYKRNLNGQGDS